MWSLFPGGRRMQGQLTGNSNPLVLVAVVFKSSWSPYPSGRLVRSYCAMFGPNCQLRLVSATKHACTLYTIRHLHVHVYDQYIMYMYIVPWLAIQPSIFVHCDLLVLKCCWDDRTLRVTHEQCRSLLVRYVQLLSRTHGPSFWPSTGDGIHY